MPADLPLIEKVDRVAEKYLVCPESHHSLLIESEAIKCSVCDFKGRIRDGVVVVVAENHTSFFDNKFEVMQQGHRSDDGDWKLCYERQAQLLESILGPGQVVLDFGCGPLLPYTPPPEAFVIGLEPSFPSIRANRKVGLRVCGTATKIPLPEQSVDTAVGFYAVHHMIGQTIQENDAIVRRVFSELARVLKPGGSLLIFEVTPWRLVAPIQRFLWNGAKRMMRDHLDMYFRSADSMSRLGRSELPNATLEVTDFKISPFAMLSPIFSLPKLRMPKMLYPLEMRLYKWRLPYANGERS